MCIRDSIVDISKIENGLDTNVYNDLKKPWYSFQSPDSVSPVKRYMGKPIIREHFQKKEVDLIRWEKCLPNRLQGAKAYAEIYKKLENLDIGENIVLEPGQTLVFDNRRCLHGRKQITKSRKNTKANRLLYRLYMNRQSTPRNSVNNQNVHLQIG